MRSSTYLSNFLCAIARHTGNYRGRADVNLGARSRSARMCALRPRSCKYCLTPCTVLPLTSCSIQQFAVLIGQLQASEDVRPQPATPAAPAPAPTRTPATPVPASTPTPAPSQPSDMDVPRPAARSAADIVTLSPAPADQTPTPTLPPPATVVTPPPQQQTVGSILWEHFRNDPSARLCTFIR